jgi:hypothetical protein
VDQRSCRLTLRGQAVHGDERPHGGAAIAMRRFVATRSALCSVHVASSAGLDLSSGEVSENAIGACVQVDGCDLDRLTDDTRYRANDSNFQATTLPLPETTTGVDEGDPEDDASVR